VQTIVEEFFRFFFFLIGICGGGLGVILSILGVQKML